MEKNLIQQRELKNKCAFCGEKDGEVLITDGETLQELHICNECDWLLCVVETYGNTGEI